MASDPNYANAWLAPQGGSGGGSNMGSNQYMSYPNVNPSQGAFHPDPNTGQYAFGQKLSGGRVVTPTMDPLFTQQFYTMLQGLTPDKLSAPQNPLLQLLQKYFSGGPSNLPGFGSLSETSQTGDPISALPAWQSMMDAQKQNIGRNQNDLREQFAFAGNLAGSPFGDAMSRFESQTSSDQNSLLAQMMQQAMESAMGRKLQASESLGSEALNFTGQAAQTGEFQQSQQQNAIQMLMQFLSQGAFANPNVMQGQTASQTFKNITSGIGDIFSGSVSKTV